MLAQLIVNGLQSELKRIETYLSTFGYGSDQASIQNAQSVLNVPVTGIIDETTLKAMQTTPRCGLSDRQAVGSINQWLKSKAQSGLSYHVVRYVNGLGVQEQEDALARAFGAWESVSKLRVFRKKSTDADIIIDASASRGEEFGTAGNVLAWAYLPQGSAWVGQLLMKFDLAERWVINTGSNSYEILYETVAIHEIGHLLGLDHTMTKGQLMYPTYNVAINKPQAGYDIDSVVTRYDKPSTTEPKPPVQPDGNPFNGVVITHQNRFYKVVPL